MDRCSPRAQVYSPSSKIECGVLITAIEQHSIRSFLQRLFYDVGRYRDLAVVLDPTASLGQDPKKRLASHLDADSREHVQRRFVNPR